MPLLPLEAFRHVFEPLQGKRIGYVRLPGNVGDRLIECAAFQLLRAYGVDFYLQDPGGPCDADELVLAGGGNMGSFYANCRAVRLRVLALGRPVSVLPQSFTDPEPFPYCRVFVRERASLRHRPDAVLAPDLALGLNCLCEGEPDRDTGLWLRRDAEGRFTQVASAGDPARRCRTPEEYLRLAARHRHLRTDRLHFAIAGLLCGRQVTLLPNRYHKNRAMYETWLRDLGCRWQDAP